MKVQHISNIFCLGYDNSKTKIFSAGNDDQVIVHDLRTYEASSLNTFIYKHIELNNYLFLDIGEML